MRCITYRYRLPDYISVISNPDAVLTRDAELPTQPSRYIPGSIALELIVNSDLDAEAYWRTQHLDQVNSSRNYGLSEDRYENEYEDSYNEHAEATTDFIWDNYAAILSGRNPDFFISAVDVSLFSVNVIVFKKGDDTLCYTMQIFDGGDLDFTVIGPPTKKGLRPEYRIHLNKSIGAVVEEQCEDFLRVTKIVKHDPETFKKTRELDAVVTEYSDF